MTSMTMAAHAAPQSSDGEIEHVRDQIDTIDRELVALIDKRFELVRTIGHIKKSTAAPIARPDREQSVLAHVERCGLPRNAAYRRSIWSGILAASRALQAEQVWSPGSWRARHAAQQPDYPDMAMIETVEAKLDRAAAVVSANGAAAVRLRMKAIVEGRGFCLQAGDCAEPIAISPHRVARDVAAIRLLADGLRLAGGEEITILARMAGQFAKPRSTASEMADGIELPVYRGDAVNSPLPDLRSRTADPRRLLSAHDAAVAISRMVAALAAPGQAPVYLSHEALLLRYEQALIERDEHGEHWSTSADMLWIGDRTRQLNGAHVEFVRGLSNVVGVKCGPGLDPDGLCRLVETIDPENRPGKLVLIGRFGAQAVCRHLPALIAATHRMGSRAAWFCDPMHGNTVRADGVKTRMMAAIKSELTDFFAIADAENVRVGGVHLETTGGAVKECLGAGEAPDHARYTSLCDPRLNPGQAREVVHLVAELRRRYRR